MEEGECDGWAWWGRAYGWGVGGRGGENGAGCCEGVGGRWRECIEDVT